MKVLLTLAALVAACVIGCMPNRENLRERVEAELRSSLSVGDSAEKIEHVLNEKHLVFTFDRFQSRYQASLDPKHWTGGEGVAVWVYVDAQKRFTKVATEVVLTGI